VTGTIAVDDPAASDIRALLEVHLSFMHEHSPAEDVHALDVPGLVDPAISFFSYRVEGSLLGIGALKQLSPTHGELKSMHTTAAARGQGVGQAMVTFLLQLARSRNYERVSLETGTMDAFTPARALYARFGFESCPPFSDYFVSANSVCMTLELGTSI
jgi:putative acetyltransferase